MILYASYSIGSRFYESLIALFVAGLVICNKLHSKEPVHGIIKYIRELFTIL